MGTTNPLPRPRKTPQFLFQPKMMRGIYNMGGYSPTKNSQYPKDIHKKQKPNWRKERKKERKN
jgi:hypothetical protein